MWMSFKYFPYGPPPSFAEPVISDFANREIGDIYLELEMFLASPPSSFARLKAARDLVPWEDFEWIKGKNIRQLCWAIDHIHKEFKFTIATARAKLGDHDYFICLIDILSIYQKRAFLSNLSEKWAVHLRDTSYLNWFSDEDESERCELAWNALKSRLAPLTNQKILGQSYRKYSGSVGIKCFFDSLEMSAHEKKSHADHVKRIWSQQKYRLKLKKEKVRQRNFVLSDATIHSLDTLAKGLSVSRTEALEHLIELAALHGMPGGVHN